METLKAQSYGALALDDSEDALLPPKRLSDGGATVAVHVSAAPTWLGSTRAHAAAEPPEAAAKRSPGKPKPPREVDPRTPGTRNRVLQQVAAALKRGGSCREEEAGAPAATLLQQVRPRRFDCLLSRSARFEARTADRPRGTCGSQSIRY